MLRKPIAWGKISGSVALLAMAFFCALQWVIAGIAYSDMWGIKSVANEAVQVQHKGPLYAWACVLLQILSAAILAPMIFFGPEEESRRSVLPQFAIRYLLALITSVTGTVVGLFLLIWVLKTFKPA